jgi:hypothetical protein
LLFGVELPVFALRPVAVPVGAFFANLEHSIEPSLQGNGASRQNALPQHMVNSMKKRIFAQRVTEQ